jgi:hypothetical protein
MHLFFKIITRGARFFLTLIQQPQQRYAVCCADSGSGSGNSH